MVTSFGTFTAQDAQNAGLQTQLAVMNEITSVSRAIMIVASNGKTHADIDFSLMTDAKIHPFCEVAAVLDTTVNVFKRACHRLQLGDELSYISSGLLPTNIQTNVFYYAIPITADEFLVAASFDNASAGVAIELGSLGTGTIQYKKYGESEKYARALYNNTNFPEYKIYQNRMNRVIQHFQDMGYVVKQFANPDTNNATFYWSFQWM